ncbi:ubiquitin-conjugating enzyme E2 Q2 [Lingula anatina]|uniref:Ubiquitin-conjugating enzyme E2 Q2 n=1 Tax=Lingula anatina TaxID=7574 RepID=A0A1S3JH89_LINAN|nr:ubiquitin-conjugating enzyme E2 Q2 [Lingula anatina]|eukprot:XP_013409506.1 ubiquitin-conjugating enzyme E2 Q2 [Lingula anatina]
MACFKTLKEDIKLLETTFPKNHERFQVVSASVDELTCRFITKSGERLEIHANITETYPQTAPIWFSETEDATVSTAIEQLCDTTPENFTIIRQVQMLVSILSQLQDLPLPQEIRGLDRTSTIKNHHSSTSKDTELFEEEDEDEIEDHDDLHYEMEEEQQESKAKEDIDGIDTENLVTLEKLKQSQRQNYLQGAVTGSIQATDRLMKELKEIYRSASFKSGTYSVELVNDSLYEWNVKIYRVDPDSALHKDLMDFKKLKGQEHITMNLLFKDSFPFDPPFVRVVQPIISGGYVLGGGAICMELLTKQGWTSAYSLESLIMQITATLVKGKARIMFGANKNQYSLARAQQSFKSLVKIHEKNGWFTPPKEDG